LTRRALGRSGALGAAFAETAVVVLAVLVALLVAPSIPHQVADAVESLRQGIVRAVRTSLP
jgi:hypothetical protein